MEWRREGEESWEWSFERKRSGADIGELERFLTGSLGGVFVFEVNDFLERIKVMLCLCSIGRNNCYI